MTGVIFDFDGVLVDTESLHLRAFQEVFAARGWALDAARYAERYLGYDDRELIETYARDTDRPLSPRDVDDLIDRKAAVYHARLSPAGLLFPGAAACVVRLAARHPLAIASGSFHDEIVQALHAADLLASFRAIVGADDVPRSKPAPDPYRLAAELLGVDPAVSVAVEDSRWGLESARAAGLRTIAVTTTSPPADLAAAHRIIGGLDELTDDLIARVVGTAGA
jgi:beta-phosphoglucomutase